MSNGVEVRMPFMDWRIVSYVFSLPLESKIGGGYTKRILRDAMMGLMPEVIRTRKRKIGINAPMIEWFSGELKEFILDEVNSSEFLQSEIWNGPAIRDFVEDRMNNNSWKWNDRTRFWPYLNAHILMTKGVS
jgi:asparagine synthase (glutamine-hydrolysing)